MKTFKFILLGLVGGLVISLCAKKLPLIEKDPNATSNHATTMADVIAADNFNWETSTNANVSIRSLDAQDNAFPNVKISILTDFQENGGTAIINGMTDEDGSFNVDYKFPGYMNEVVVTTDHIGFINEAKVPIVDGTINFTLGGSTTTISKQHFIPAPNADNYKNSNE